MDFLNDPANTAWYFLFGAGVIMVFALATSKKAHNVVKTSVDLSRQTAGDEMFGSSRFARRLVRSVLNSTEYVVAHVPASVKSWVNSRFNQDEAIMPQGAAFDIVRASVNLVLAGLLIVVGTSLKLPLSTTYVAFMVGMGSSLADRAWGRESAVFRVTGVISVIGGWFMTAGAAFFLCFIVSLILYFGGVVAMIALICLVVFMMIRNNHAHNKKKAAVKQDEIFTKMMENNDTKAAWPLLSRHVCNSHAAIIDFLGNTYMLITEGLIDEDVKKLRHAFYNLSDEKKNWKVVRRKEILGMRKIEPLLAVEKNTWFHLGNNSVEQSIYCLKRMCEPALEHVDNNFNPLPVEYVKEFEPIRAEVKEIIDDTRNMVASGNYELSIALREKGDAMKSKLSAVRKLQQDRITKDTDLDMLKIQFLYLSILQETQELISHLRHLVRASRRFQQ